MGCPSPAAGGAAPDPPRLGIQEAPTRPSVAASDRAGEGRLPAWSGSPGRRWIVVESRRQGEAPRRPLQHSERGYYYDQSAGYDYSPAPWATPFHLLVFLVTVALLGATSLYSRYESAVESLVDQVRFAVVLSPLLLLLTVQYWAATAGSRRPRGGALSSLLVGDQPSWYAGGGWGQHQRDGGSGAASPSPWGVALALALVLLLVSYQSCFRDMWFPLVSRRWAELNPSLAGCVTSFLQCCSHARRRWGRITNLHLLRLCLAWRRCDFDKHTC